MSSVTGVAIEPLIVTTSSKSRNRGTATDDARAWAERLNVPFVPCIKGVAVETLLARATCVLVLRRDGVVLLDAHGSARWSAGMADLRIRRLDEGVPQSDHVLLTGEIRAGDAVLDCTLGRGHDALVLARAVGPSGKVVAIEKSLPLFAWTSAGLARREPRSSACAIECLHGDAREVLHTLPSRSFDCVFFDPMFTKRAHYEAGFASVRRHAEMAALDSQLLALARRVARRWVVVKTAPQSTDLLRLGITPMPFKRNAELRFGRIEPA